MDYDMPFVGDGGYPLEPWLLTPYRTPNTGSVEEKFNDVHSKCRNIIERTNGVLKNRWSCLLGARELYYAPQKAIKITNLCAALHNICIEYKCDSVKEVVSDEEDSDCEFDTTAENNRYLSAAQRIRGNIANSL